MLNIVNLEEIQRLLLRVPGLIHDLAERQMSLIGSVKTWLTDGEQILINNRLPVAAEVAALRGVLISAERGVIPPGVAFSARTTVRKIKEAAAADVLRKAADAIFQAIAADAARIAEGEKLMRQILAVAQRKGISQVSAYCAYTHSDMLKAIWRAMTEDPDLGGGATHLEGLVGINDALVLLDRMLPTGPGYGS